MHAAATLSRRLCVCLADADEAAYRGIAEGLLLQALGPLVAAASCASGSALHSLLAARNLGLPGVPAGTQSVPDCSRIAPPVHSPVEKDRVRLQVWLCTARRCHLTVSRFLVCIQGSLKPNMYVRRGYVAACNA